MLQSLAHGVEQHHSHRLSTRLWLPRLSTPAPSGVSSNTRPRLMFDAAVKSTRQPETTYAARYSDVASVLPPAEATGSSRSPPVRRRTARHRLVSPRCWRAVVMILPAGVVMAAASAVGDVARGVAVIFALVHVFYAALALAQAPITCYLLTQSVPAHARARWRGALQRARRLSGSRRACLPAGYRRAWPASGYGDGATPQAW